MAVREVPKDEQTKDGRKWIYEVRYKGKRYKSKKYITKKDGTRFGIKIDGDKMFRIAMNKGNTFVYLDSSSPNTLESFLGQQKDEIEQEYETDSEYDDKGRDYGD